MCCVQPLLYQCSVRQSVMHTAVNMELSISIVIVYHFVFCKNGFRAGIYFSGKFHQLLPN